MSTPIASFLLLAGVLSASQFAGVVRSDGPKAAVAQLVSGGDWPRVMASVRNGTADWIALAPELARGVEGAQAGELSAALAAALPRAPSDVLAVTDLRRSPVLGVQAVCGAPAGSFPAGGRAAYLADAREALELLPDVAAIGRAKAVCLKELELAAK
ncbi:hypothetical protein [Sandarakinorhabdus rubra]|uniref:hypothetical protein n=1 Tax=Sandarakinorhabdus rubra TaxID=2672568 RepID=UPI0013DD4AE9|nr:hypothetical protein [Sandarakinorhabdus rubra]